MVQKIRTVLVEELAGADQVGGAPRQVRSGAPEHVGARGTQSGRRQQRRVQIGLPAVEGARRGDRVLERVPKVG